MQLKITSISISLNEDEAINLFGEIETIMDYTANSSLDEFKSRNPTIEKLRLRLKEIVINNQK